jgi:hypothetical protein
MWEGYRWGIIRVVGFGSVSRARKSDSVHWIHYGHVWQNWGGGYYVVPVNDIPALSPNHAHLFSVRENSSEWYHFLQSCHFRFGLKALEPHAVFLCKRRAWKKTIKKWAFQTVRIQHSTRIQLWRICLQVDANSVTNKRYSCTIIHTGIQCM